ncbi:PucC family protein [Synechocystis sp. LEGE 06083]|uniref:PucC family protein n=1 Tax=Synechocystis sp. LEGE 06083 TaxID=915336 RepID=UPI001881685E|nr:PucC family protein [Synechocystis sp. LEGE 06083]MBE9196903.1 PucC family protein [Synechocystis sp. LEGE 06083]
MTVSESMAGAPLPKLPLVTMFRLGLFQMGLGIMSLLTLGVLNRILIDELAVLPWVAATAIAMYQFVSPFKVWCGQLSDSQRLWGYHRTGYVWLGALGFTVLSFIALQVVWQLGLSLQNNGWGALTIFWSIALGTVFAAYGVTLSLSSTPFAALLVDVSDEDNRSKLVGIVWSMLMVGIVLGAIVSSRLLNTPEICGRALLDADALLVKKTVDIAQLQRGINPVFIIMPGIVVFLAWLATVGVEKKYSRFGDRSEGREDEITLGQAVKVLTASRQTAIFFGFLLLLTLSLFMQDAVLEPYGGEVFNLCISETTQLNAFFGMGTLLGIGSTGFFVVPRLGKQRTTSLGCALAALCFSLLILAGFQQNVTLLKSGLLFFGLASGMITAGATSLMLDLTAVETAGTFIGAWGLAQSISRGLATVAGGTILNIGKALFANAVLAYGLVFALQALGLILSIFLLNKVNVREFQDNAKTAIATVMAGDLDS